MLLVNKGYPSKLKVILLAALAASVSARATETRWPAPPTANKTDPGKIDASKKPPSQIRLILPQDPRDRLIGLTIDPSRLAIEQVQLSESGTETIPMIRVEGKYTRADWTLLWRTRPLPFGKFSLTLPLQGRETHVPFQVVGPAGVIEQEEALIVVDNWESFMPRKTKLVAEPPKEAPSRSTLVLSLGPSYIAYSQPAVPDFTEFGSTFKVFYLYQLVPQRWDFGASAYYTLLPIVTSREGITASFLGMNLRIGYVIPFVHSPWRLSILAGAYYASMFVTQNAFGFTNLTGPQLFPTLKRSFTGGDSASIYFKLSPVTNGATLLSISSRELAGGFGYMHPMEGGHSVSFNVDVSNMQLVYGNSIVGTTNNVTSLTTYNFSLGYGW